MKNSYKNGDIVYVLNRYKYDFRLRVRPAVVYCQYDGGTVAVDFITMKDSRIIDGISIYDYLESPIKKLPKEWNNYHDPKTLYTLTYDKDILKYLNSYKINDKENIKNGIEKGILKVGEYPMSIQTRITKDGYYVYVDHLLDQPNGGTYQVSGIYNTYDEAKAYVDSYYKELERQASLSDEEWSKEQIEKNLRRYFVWYKILDEDQNRIRNIIFSLPHIEDVETRIMSGQLQWKYEKNKRWNTV